MSSLHKFVQKPFDPSGPVQDAASLCGIVCECARSECVNSFGTQLKAIVLTGSMAREEASFVRKDDSWELFGDAEFIVVLEKNAVLPPTATLRAIRQRIENDLRQRKIQCAIDLSAVRPSYFRQLPPHIFSYELKHCGQVIGGDDQILQGIPNWSVDDLSLQDAWRLLCNRMIEVLECAAELSNDGKPPSARLRYKILKLYLDMATSLLVFVRAYAPTYQERRKILRQLADQRTDAGEYPFDLGSFADRVEACTNQKLLVPSNKSCSLDLSWRDAIETAHSLWRWELSRLTGFREQVSDRELFSQWMRMQPFIGRTRGWVYVLRASGWHKSYRHWLRWLHLGWKASPRYWIYFVASIVLFQLTTKGSPSTRQLQQTDWASLGGVLPVRKMPAKAQEQPSWKNLASDVVWNYQKFVVGTRA
jgi:hypothetical protein